MTAARSLSAGLAWALLGVGVTPGAYAAVEETPRWVVNRRPGGALPPLPLSPPAGWRLGLVTTAPQGWGLTLGYLLPAEPMALKLGASWGIWAPSGFNWNPADHYRFSAGALYYLVPGGQSGPYVELGVTGGRYPAPRADLPWPFVPHAALGATGHWGEALTWDLACFGLPNGLLGIEAGVFL
ncbi:MAG: hypothetical protein VKP62_03505 [Candidatus Sericytochromatia bacterium]|nr:hypothetical protein [Candidatus Sericytochromatia bacterium]